MERTVVDNRYVLSGLLGGGGMGRVFLARDEVLERDVALKVLREQYAEDEEFVGRFEREAKAAASLNHPNIVQVYDRGEAEEGSYYIAMEYIAGGTLKDRILKEGPMDAAEAVRLAMQVADALGVAHASGIVHRDVKPQNVLLTADGDAKVADFGIARAASEVSLSDSGLVLGTAKYMSPEQAMGDPIGPESDLYSLGVVLYEMLTGEVPFEADSAIGVAMKHVNEAPRPPREANPEVPEALDAVVMKLLQKKPEDRYPGAAELVADLSRVGEGLSPVFAAPAASPSTSGAETTRAPAQPLALAPVPGNPGGAPRGFVRSPRRRRRRRRRRARLLAAALVALLAVLGLAGLGSSGGLDGPVVGSLGKATQEAQRALGVGKGEVPNVVGLAEEEARDRLTKEGFGVAVERRASGEEDEGRVLEQSVPAGEEVERGSRIALAVGSGPRTVEAPDLVGLTLAEAEKKLEEVGLKPGGRKEAPSEEVPEGEVSAQDPAAGKKTEAGTEVDLTVSSGPPAASEPDQIEVPDDPSLGVGDGGPGAPPAGGGAPSGDPAAQPAPSSSASATASPDASASPEPPSEPAPSPSPRADAPRPSSPEPAPSSPAPSSPTPSSPEPSLPEPSLPEPSSPAPSSPEAPAEPTPSPGQPVNPPEPSSSAPSSPPPSSSPATAPPAAPLPSESAPSAPPSAPSSSASASSPAPASPSSEPDGAEDAGEGAEGFE
ncbi:MAG: Stk1 family PASTA domain-containing Ser/Thr kinase [Actinomycetota bacterium]|nr:Stk1 family PASTA domain-containing Ser/Thr kinase [Actinomycetota bacterium]